MEQVATRAALASVASPSEGDAAIVHEADDRIFIWSSGDHSGERATGSVTFVAVPAEGSVIIINGRAITITASPVSGQPQIELVHSLPGMAIRLYNYVNANSGTIGVTAGRVDATVTLTANEPGLTGNLIGLWTDDAGVAFSGPLLTGGTFAPDKDQGAVSEHVAPTSAPSGSAGLWIPRMDRITPAFFGKYDGSNGHALLQALADMAGRHPGFVCEVDRRYIVDKHVRIPSNTIWEGVDSEAAIVSVNAEAAPQRSAIITSGWHGSYLPNKTGYHATAVYQNTDSTENYYTTNSSLVGTPFKIYDQRLEWLDCDSVEPGKEIKLTSAADVAKIPVGSVIFIRDKNYYFSGSSTTGNGNQIPLFMMPTVRIDRQGESMPAGYIALAHALPRAITSPQIAIAENPLSLFTQVQTFQTKYLYKGMPVTDYFASRGAEQILAPGTAPTPNRGTLVVGRNIRFYGIGLESLGAGSVSGGSAISGYGMQLECDLDIPWVKGRTGAYVQGFAHSRIQIGHCDVWEKGLECALNWVSSRIIIGSVSAHTHPETDTNSCINVGENCTDLSIDIGTVILEDGVDSTSPALRGIQYAVRLGACRGVRLKIANLAAPVEQALVGVAATKRAGAVDPGESDSWCEDITIEIGRATSRNTAMSHYLHMNNAAGNLRNVDIRANFYRDVAVSALHLAGEHVRFQGYVPGGAISVSGTTGLALDVHGGVTGLSGVPASPAMLRINGVDVETAPLYGSATYDPPSLASGATAMTTVTVAGAAIGDTVVAWSDTPLTGSAVSRDYDELQIVSASVTAADTVTVMFKNPNTNPAQAAIDAASTTIRAKVKRRT